MTREATIVLNCLTHAFRQLCGAPEPKPVGGVELTPWAFLRCAQLYLNEETNRYE